MTLETQPFYRLELQRKASALEEGVEGVSQLPLIGQLAKRIVQKPEESNFWQTVQSGTNMIRALGLIDEELVERMSLEIRDIGGKIRSRLPTPHEIALVLNQLNREAPLLSGLALVVTGTPVGFRLPVSSYSPEMIDTIFGVGGILKGLRIKDLLSRKGSKRPEDGEGGEDEENTLNKIAGSAADAVSGARDKLRRYEKHSSGTSFQRDSVEPLPDQYVPGREQGKIVLDEMSAILRTISPGRIRITKRQAATLLTAMTALSLCCSLTLYTWTRAKRVYEESPDAPPPGVGRRLLWGLGRINEEDVSRAEVAEQSNYFLQNYQDGELDRAPTWSDPWLKSNIRVAVTEYPYAMFFNINGDYDSQLEEMFGAQDINSEDIKVSEKKDRFIEIIVQARNQELISPYTAEFYLYRLGVPVDQISQANHDANLDYENVVGLSREMPSSEEFEEWVNEQIRKGIQDRQEQWLDQWIIEQGTNTSSAPSFFDLTSLSGQVWNPELHQEIDQQSTQQTPPSNKKLHPDPYQRGRGGNLGKYGRDEFGNKV